MYAVVMYLSGRARIAMQRAGDTVKAGFKVIFGDPVRTLPDGATLWHTPHTSWEWDEVHPLVEFLRSLKRDRNEVFEVLFLDDASDRVVHEYNLRPDEDEKLGTNVSFTFMQEELFKEPEEEQQKNIAQKCGNCRFWDYCQNDNGTCRLNPPVVLNERSCEGVWPVTDRDSRCGKFEERS